MAKIKVKYICSNCGAIANKWSGQCDNCNEWNCMTEEDSSSAFSKVQNSKAKPVEFSKLSDNVELPPRHTTSIAEMNRVLGGGLVNGSAVLIGGDPGIGKSTILLQLIANMSSSGLNCAYITGEESQAQVRLRAKRLGVDKTDVHLAAATSVDNIIATIVKNKLDVIIIDSIQTMFVEEISSAPGTVTQVRMSAHELINAAKKYGTTILLVGHVTKEGQIAGPKVLEHMVDTVLYFEGDRGHQFRILRSVKNRFGAANEIGVFEMTGEGLQEVTNPSALFITGKAGEVSGSVVFAGIEGSRTVMVEIQALVAPTQAANPRRSIVGWDNNRLAMILAVLETRCGIKFSDKEVYLNVAGGMRITEPAADLAVAAALISALTNVPINSNGIIFGEIGLSGEIRPVSHTIARLKEAEKLGFSNAITPPDVNNKSKNFTIQEIKYISQLDKFFKD